MDCRDLKAVVDSYISDELLVETNHEVLRHLENCNACRSEMSGRRLLKIRVRETVKGSAAAQIDVVFAMRMASNLKEMALRPTAWDRLTSSGGFLNMRVVAAGFASIIVVALVGVLWTGRSSSPGTEARLQGNNSNTEMVDAVRISWSEMTALAVGDHENCAVEFNLKERPISLDEAAKKFGSFNKDLDKVVVAAFNADKDVTISADTKFIKAHSCLFEGRLFSHVLIEHKGRVVSLLMTDTDLPAGKENIQTAHFVHGITATGFQIGNHAVFVVSQLADADNLALARTLAPALRLHVDKLKA